MYRSQSVLNKLGYNVQQEKDLSDIERHQILAKAIDSQMVNIADTIDFLNWLVRTHETQIKYKNAVSKWKIDIEYIKGYRIDERNAIVADSITIK